MSVPVHRPLILNGATTVETKSDVIGASILSQCKELAFIVRMRTGSTQGVVTIEGSKDAAFTGTWYSVATITWATAANKEYLAAITGVHLNLRARVSTAVDGQGVDCDFIGN